MTSHIKSIIFAFAVLFISSCGGGGGNDPCNSAKNTSTRMAGGNSCDDGSPNVALLIVFDKQGRGVGQCTGAYVSLTSVLTAAHCFQSFPNGGGVLIASPGNRRFATKITQSRLYNGSVNSPFDLAILSVNQPLDGGAPLPVMLSRHPEQGEDVVVYGFGKDENGNGFGERIENGDAPLRAAYTTFAGYFSGTVAIVSSGDGSVCPGDSGGPVLAKNESGEWGIIGVTRAGPSGCSAEKGRPSYLSSTQSNGAVSFLSAAVPDLAVN